MTDGSHTPDAANLLAAAQALALDVATASMVAVFRARGIDCLLIRGAAIANLLYPSGERTYVDADLLVEPRHFADAEAALAEVGYREAPLETVMPTSRPWHAHTWVRSDGRTVDLHQTLIGVAGPPDRLWAALREDAEQLELEGIAVPIPSRPGLALIVALHAAHHVDRSGQPLRDLALALELLPAAVWDEAAQLARRVDSLGAFASGLRLDSRGETELKRLGLLAIDDREPSAAGGGRSFHVAQGIAWLRVTPGLRAKAALLHERLLPSPRTMRRRSQLARHGLVGLALAYLVRLLDAAWHLPDALRAIRRAR